MPRLYRVDVHGLARTDTESHGQTRTNTARYGRNQTSGTGIFPRNAFGAWQHAGLRPCCTDAPLRLPRTSQLQAEAQDPELA